MQINGILIHGEQGVGKSMLIKHVMAKIDTMGLGEISTL